MLTIRASNHRQRQRERILADKGGVQTVRVDYSPWAADNGSVSSVIASVEHGNAAIGGESLAANIKTMTITTAESGASLIKLVAYDGSADKDVRWIEVIARDPATEGVEDYGMMR